MRVARSGIALAALFHLVSPACVLAQSVDYVPPADELTYASVIIESMFPAEEREQMVLDLAGTIANQAASGMMSGPIFEEPGIRAIMEEFLADLPETLRPTFSRHLPKIFEATAIAYTREFTLEELRDISTFAQTPSGRRYFLTLQKLQSDPAVAFANQEMFKDVAPVQQEQANKVRLRVQEYLMANPEVLERLEKAGVGQ